MKLTNQYSNIIIKGLAGKGIKARRVDDGVIGIDRDSCHNCDHFKDEMEWTIIPALPGLVSSFIKEKARKNVHVVSSGKNDDEWFVSILIRS